MDYREKIPKNKKSIKTKIFLGLLGAGIVPLVSFSAVSGSIIRQSMYDSQISSLKQISSLITENLDKWGDDKIILVEDIATSQIIKSNNIELIQSELKNKSGQDTSIINIMYVDTEGKVISDSLGSKDMHIGNETYFKDVCIDYSYVSNVINDGNEPFIIFSSPVKVDNEVIGYILNKVKADSIGKDIGNITYSEKAQTFVFNREGDIAYHNDINKIMSENLIDAESSFSVAAKKSLEGNFNSIDYVYEGEKGSAVYNYIPSLNWGTIITIPNEDIYSGFKQVFLVTIPIMGAIIVLILLLVTYVLKKIMTILNKVSSFTKEVADGNLKVKSDLGEALELANISDNLNVMVENLKKLILSINDNSIALNEASTELYDVSIAAEENSKDISNAMEDISGGSIYQAEKTENVLIEVKGLDEYMEQLMDGVKHTNEALKISSKALLKGHEETEELQSKTEEQSELVTKAVAEVNALADFVESIDIIIDTLAQISDQTSLLALNASIEAARAGESGKGFAVVAEEVGKLSNESQKSTQKISDILLDIRNKSDSTQKIMDLIDKGMKTQKNTVEDTMSIFREINKADKKIEENIKDFSGMSDYVKNITDRLLDLIENLASGSEENAAIAEEVTASAEGQIEVIRKVTSSGDNISKVVQELKENVDKFKTE